MARERQEEAQLEKCISCGNEIQINPWGYSPPVTDQSIMDTGFYREEDKGYVCINCISGFIWSEEDNETLEHDGWL